MNTYIWSVEQLITQDIQGLDRVVVAVNYLIRAQDSTGQFSYEYRAGQRLDSSGVDPSQFVAYADLSESQVLTWVTDAMGQDEVQRTISVIDVALDGVVNAGRRITRNRLPWDPAPGEGLQDHPEPFLQVLLTPEQAEIYKQYR